MLENTFVKPLEFGQWLYRKPSAGLIWHAPSDVQYAAFPAGARAATDLTSLYPTAQKTLGSAEPFRRAHQLSPVFK